MSIRNPLALALALALGGCVIPAYNTFTRSFTISGGGTVEFTFTNGLVPEENADAKLVPASLEVKPSVKTLTYKFLFFEKTGNAPRSVVVEDVSGPAPEILVEDDHPALIKKAWLGTSGPKTADDPRLGWLNEPDDSFRIYRVTIVTSDGRRLVMYTAAGYAAPAKELFKKMLGLGKAP